MIQLSHYCFAALSSCLASIFLYPAIFIHFVGFAKFNPTLIVAYIVFRIISGDLVFGDVFKCDQMITNDWSYLFCIRVAILMVFLEMLIIMFFIIYACLKLTLYLRYRDFDRLWTWRGRVVLRGACVAALLNTVLQFFLFFFWGGEGVPNIQIDISRS